MDRETYRTGMCPKNFSSDVWGTLTEEQKIAVQHLRSMEERQAEQKSKAALTEALVFSAVPLAIFLGMKDYFVSRKGFEPMEPTVGSAVGRVVLYLLACGLFLGVFSSAYTNLIVPEKENNKLGYVAKMVGAVFVSLVIGALIYRAVGIM